MDSREYRLIYSVHTNADIPADFPQEVRHCRFERAVFVPQDDSDWYTRPPKFPARLLLLRARSVSVVSHPTSGLPDIDIPLQELTQLETGCILLRGWIKFTTKGRTFEVLYNTRASNPLERFVCLLRERWLQETGSLLTRAAPLILGDELDIKFRNLLHSELTQEETVVIQCFQLPIKFDRNLLLVHRVSWQAGHLLALTTHGRIVWITDDYRQSRAFYAGINRSAPVCIFKSCGLEVIDERLQLVTSFDGGNVWRAPVCRVAVDASTFAQGLLEQVSDLRAPKTANKGGS